MRRILLVLLTAIVLASFVSAEEAAGTERRADQQASKEVLQVEAEANQALVKSDVKVLGRIWADDISYTSADGALVTKADFLNSLRTGELKVYSIVHSDIRQHVYGDTVVVTGYSRSKAETHGKISTGPRRFTNVYVRRDGRWQLVVHHVTLARK